ncbi:L domain-like protein [Suhomyces tanzawaensis NRRL Y-17324]|uniref:L domain-like protein n=1 Tax=Suhomyces tanzawaensis NRRL Y-17324 TaxID=984487 RepID=A0A1E4SDE1_9ASCO|nr:L domain-like protein [Suhomyces tanzawaensis NRRL Y-17324]ODV77486.1 L domain-like protein [Suhomyces tanzawaensis NRRL Y-17324]
MSNHHGIRRLPVELLERIFDILLANFVYQKLIDPYPCGLWNEIQQLAYRWIFSNPFLVRNYHKTRGFDHSKLYYQKSDVDNAFLVQGFDLAYRLLRQLTSYNLETANHVFPREMGMLFRFTDDPGLVDEITSFAKVLELLSFDHYQDSVTPKICFQLVYDITMTPELMLLNLKLVQRIEALGDKTQKLLSVNRFNSQSQANNLHPFHASMSENLEELYLWNNSITDYSIKQYLRTSPPVLKVLDLTANTIMSLKELVLPPSLEKFLVGANNLKSLEGPNYHECTKLHTIDASINTISSLQNIKFPLALRTLRISYNEVFRIDQEQIPTNIEVLELSRNLIKYFDDYFVLPSTVRELHLNANGLYSFPNDFFALTTQLRILDISDNKIDDLDELGELPMSIQELTLDNNEIDYSNYSNILTPNLKKLSMNSTGLVEVSDLEFPSKLEILNLANNEISIFKHLQFTSELKRLDLSENKLTTFNLPQDNINIPPSLEYLDLSHNPFGNFESMKLPPKLTNLLLKDIALGQLTNELISKLPDTLQELRLDHTAWLHDKSENPSLLDLSLDFRSLLPCLRTLSLTKNKITLIKDTTYPSSLSFLSYEHNNITKIELDNVPTGIKHLQLNDNWFHFQERVEVSKLPYFPYISYFGLCGNQTELMRLGIMYK